MMTEIRNWFCQWCCRMYKFTENDWHFHLDNHAQEQIDEWLEGKIDERLD